MYGHDHVEVAKTLVRLKESYYHAFWTINARDSLERAIAIQEKAYGSDHPSVINTMCELVELYRDLDLRDRTSEKRKLLKRLLPILTRVHGPDYYMTQNCRSELAKLGSSTCAVQ